MIESFKQCKSKYINIVWCFPTKLYACFTYFTYHNKQTLEAIEKLV